MSPPIGGPLRMSPPIGGPRRDFSRVGTTLRATRMTAPALNRESLK